MNVLKGMLIPSAKICWDNIGIIESIKFYIVYRNWKMGNCKVMRLRVESVSICLDILCRRNKSIDVVSRAA